ncbi:hypothetical protein KG112_10210 [Nocardioides sp. zg-ZUI104]|uniref:DUF6049 family protein n=1 Tax=Nocardioides faecalis TaxID=2803858 RepID=UPI001BCBE3F2|nr:DUF6049 family protein [Nocardioides faecalis]MBS4753176.1 hypothetical protein [Nocardioides faecalis]
MHLSPVTLRRLAGAVGAVVLTVTATTLPANAEPRDDTISPSLLAPGSPSGSPSSEGVSQRDGQVSRGTARAPSTEDDTDTAPLSLTIDRLTPGELPRRGPLEVRGTVTNSTLETWRDISLFPIFNAGSDCASASCAPVMTTSAQLAAAVETDPETPLAVRNVETSDEIELLTPGQTASYSLRIPQRELRRIFGKRPTPGVYWFGVHALGASLTNPYDNLADGRARTFLPYVPGSTDAVVDTAVVLPLRAAITRTADGALARTADWLEALSLDGTLGGPLAFGTAAGDRPMSWLVDPAVPDAVRNLASGNPARAIRQLPDPDLEPTTETPDTTATDEPGEDDGNGTSQDRLPDTDPLVLSARSWLAQARAVLPDDAVLGLPFGDPDISSAAEFLPELYPIARRYPGVELTDWGVDATRAVASPDGYLDPAALETVDDGAVIILADGMFDVESFSETPRSDSLIGESPVVPAERGAAQGGPGPDARKAPVALRQRILSEAALRALDAADEDPAPLTVVLPATLDADGSAAFWDGLETDWLRLRTVAELTVPAPGDAPAAQRQLDLEDLVYPADRERREISRGVMTEADRLIQAAHSLQSILGDRYDIGAELTGEALTGTSFELRRDDGVQARLARAHQWVTERLAMISVETPNGVTLSGRSGGFSVALRNDLPHPVTVNLSATTDDGARIEVPNPIQLAANSRTSVPISAELLRTGVHNVAFRVTDAEGTAISGVETLPLRSGRVGAVIWVIIGTGAAILFLAIGIRLRRRIRDHRHPDEAQAQAGPA